MAMKYCKKHDFHYLEKCPQCNNNFFYGCMSDDAYRFLEGLGSILGILGPVFGFLLKICIPIIVFIIGISLIFGIVKTVILVPVNLGCVHIGYQYGIGQYLDNIGHFQDDSYMVLNQRDSLYTTELKGIEKLKRGQAVELKGYKRDGSVTWIAIKFYKGNEPVYGYLKHPKDIGWGIWTINEKLGNKEVELPGNTEKEKFLQKIDNSKNTVIAISNCNIRKLPNIKSEKIKLLNSGTEVEYLSLDSGWYKLKIDSAKFGYVKSENVYE